MIVATVGHHQFALHGIADAEKLLNILNNALPVEQTHDAESYESLFYKSHRGNLSIAIVNASLVSAEEAKTRSTKKPLAAVAA